MNHTPINETNTIARARFVAKRAFPAGVIISIGVSAYLTTIPKAFLSDPLFILMFAPMTSALVVLIVHIALFFLATKHDLRTAQLKGTASTYLEIAAASPKTRHYVIAFEWNRVIVSLLSGYVAGIPVIALHLFR